MTADEVRAGREVYRDLLTDMMVHDERIVCLDSDTGLFTSVDFGPAANRYVNVGIAELNMMGIAAGLARSGRVPVVNTMATFAVTRALESVKVNVALTGLPVRIVATHGGLAAGHLGPTHHSLEDLAIMRTLPNVTVVVPADAGQTRSLFSEAVATTGPVYFRLGRGATPDLPANLPAARLGEAQTVHHTNRARVTIVACGPYPVTAALDAAAELEAGGVAVTVLNMHTVKPLDVTALLAAAGSSEVVVTVEEHWAAGGLGSAVAEVLAELAPVRVIRVAAAGHFFPVAGSQSWLLARAGVDHNRVVAAARRGIGEPDSPS
ncbi:transketolase family protein [Amycolatopsis magusensis]|uniref:Transketolase n=1 Tax=Amycolatopsis magusensis TaxID=882444 RepID=A0ABS4PU38_9PSEU|nr:transketolase C-terminal domain-containing protein [Amycolatopsis magusensis]MBP2182942.1 transketolase [Amycolatopsis magusensis]